MHVAAPRTRLISQPRAAPQLVKSRGELDFAMIPYKGATELTVALLRLPLATVLLGMGGLSSIWAWRQLAQLEKHAGPPT